jgi:hypothetical protein
MSIGSQNPPAVNENFLVPEQKLAPREIFAIAAVYERGRIE